MRKLFTKNSQKMTSKINIACFQTAKLTEEKLRLDFYLKKITAKNARLFVLGEYVFNPFFKDIKDPKALKEKTKQSLKTLKELCEFYDIKMIIPIVSVKKNTFLKQIALISSKSIKYYNQRLLMPYKHWNEKQFFSPCKVEKELIFSIENWRFLVIGGFEIHFDKFWQNLKQKKIDCVIIPTANTFGSSKRWRELVKTRAFLHQVYIFRVNKIGFSKLDNWEFYGDSLLVNPFGEIDDFLGHKEELMINTLEKQTLKQARKTWMFDEILKGISKPCASFV